MYGTPGRAGPPSLAAAAGPPSRSRPGLGPPPRAASAVPLSRYLTRTILVIIHLWHHVAVQSMSDLQWPDDDDHDSRFSEYFSFLNINAVGP
jgi:hypothetical protein